MKKYTFFLFVLLAACHSPQPSGKDIITVSILPQKYLVERIAGDQLQVDVLLPPGANHSTYSLLPSQMKNLSKSKAWFRMEHLTFEESLHEKIEQLNPNLDIFTASDGIELITGMEACEEHDHGHDHGEGIDPHYWMSPNEIRIVARNILNGLLKITPEKEENFRKNYTLLENEIKELETSISETLKDTPIKRFLIFHPALAYYARQFGLEQVAIEDMGKEPSVSHIREVVEQAREKNVKVIFIQKEYDQENAQIIAEEIGGKVIQIDPMKYDWFAQMKEITTNLKSALK